MVPQPMSELVARVKDNQSAAFWVVLIEIIVLTVLSWFLSRQIAAPIQNVVTAAKKSPLVTCRLELQNIGNHL